MKVVTKVRSQVARESAFPPTSQHCMGHNKSSPIHSNPTDQPTHPRRPNRRDRRPHHRLQRLVQDHQVEQDAHGYGLDALAIRQGTP